MLLLQAFLLNFVIFSVVWAFAQKYKFYGIIDLTWTFSVFLYASFYFVYSPQDLSFSIMSTVLAVPAVWSIRLGSHLFKRLKKHGDDPRYVKLQEKWKGEKIGLKYFLVFQTQNLLNVFLTLPFYWIATHVGEKTPYLLYVGLSISILGIIGETFADKQLEEFKKDLKNHGKVCRKGLWAYSRHPNYFFEFIIWLGYFVSAVSYPYGFLTIISPILILGTLYKVTGIPATERQALASKGEAYRVYQEEVSEFIPWFKRKQKS